MVHTAGEPARAQQLIGDPVDSSQDFYKLENVYFVGDHVVSFDPATGTGVLEWKRYGRRAEAPVVRSRAMEAL